MFFKKPNGSYGDWFDAASYCCKYGMRLANLPPERFECFGLANKGTGFTLPDAHQADTLDRW
jgi:hypothetical protein